MKMVDKKLYKNLKKEYKSLKLEYIREKFRIKDEKRDQLKDLKYDYKYKRLAVKTPLKAEKYKIKVENKKRHRAMNEPPRRSLLEEIGNSVSHGVGAIIAIVLMILMINKSQTGLAVFSSVVYGMCLFLSMLASCLYHSFRAGSTVKRVFRRFDYSTIYLLIAGTFSPLYLIYWGNTLGIVLFFVQWALIVFGITMVSIFGPGRIRWLHYTLYFLIGWSGLMFLPDFISNCLPLLWWILAGGLCYTLGMIPFAMFKNRAPSHFIWHLCVLAGAILQWVGIYMYVF